MGRVWKFFNTSQSHISYAQGVRLGEENTITRDWSFHNCQNTEGWEGCRLWWNPSWKLWISLAGKANCTVWDSPCSGHKTGAWPIKSRAGHYNGPSTFDQPWRLNGLS